jgi:rhamnulose-1-phosphate aldolase
MGILEEGIDMKRSAKACLGQAAEAGRDLWEKGWAEGSFGNLSLRLDPEMDTPDGLPLEPPDWKDLPVRVPELGGQRFLVSGTGMRFRESHRTPSDVFGIIELDAAGQKYCVRWGFHSPGGPTSELPAHLMTHAVFQGSGREGEAAVIHAHPTHAIALCYTMELDTRILSRLLWEIHAESIVVFPEGVAFIPWTLPGSRDLAERTASALKEHRLVIWQFQGVMAAGKDLNEAFSRIEVLEKGLEIYFRVMQAGGFHTKPTPRQINYLVRHLDLCPAPDILKFSSV